MCTKAERKGRVGGRQIGREGEGGKKERWKVREEERERYYLIWKNILKHT